MLGRPLSVVIVTLAMVFIVAKRQDGSRLRLVVLVFESALFGAALLWLAQSLDAAGLTSFGRWFHGH